MWVMSGKQRVVKGGRRIVGTLADRLAQSAGQGARLHTLRPGARWLVGKLQLATCSQCAIALGLPLSSWLVERRQGNPEGMQKYAPWARAWAHPPAQPGPATGPPRPGRSGPHCEVPTGDRHAHGTLNVSMRWRRWLGRVGRCTASSGQRPPDGGALWDSESCAPAATRMRKRGWAVRGACLLRRSDRRCRKPRSVTCCCPSTALSTLAVSERRILLFDFCGGDASFCGVGICGTGARRPGGGRLSGLHGQS